MRYSFVQDVRVAEELHVVTVRSQRASAVLSGVDLPELPEGVTAVTARDIPGDNVMEFGGGRMPVLADGEVHYVGEPVALIAARDLGLAQTLAGSVALGYSDLSAEERLRTEGAVHTEELTRGDPSGPLSAAEAVEAYELVTMPRRFAPPAPQEVVVIPDGQIVLVRAATQHPFHVRATVAAVLGIAAARVRVIAEPVDGAGGKLLMPSLVAAHAALIALRAQAPARARYSWREELGVAFRIAGTRTAWRIAPPRDGRPAAVTFDLSVEGGACDLVAPEVLRSSVRALTGPYDCENLAIRASYRAEETVPCELPPGCGELESVCARELCADSLARAAGMDPAEWRLENLATEGAKSPHRPSGLVGVIEEAVRVSGFGRRYAAYEAVRERRGGAGGSGMPMRGVGIAVATFRGGFDPSAEVGTRVRVSMGKDRRVLVQTSAVDVGRGSSRLFARVVSEALGIPVGQVSVAPVDTGGVPSSGPTARSRSAALLVPLLRRCCATLKGRLRRRPPPCSAESAIRASEGTERYSSAATVATVEVDPETRVLRCTGIWAVIDAGELLDPDSARAVAAAALVRGLGIALIEESEAAVVPVPPAMDPYATLTPTYRIARLSDIGSIHVSFLDRAKEHIRHAPGGISELALLGVAPAVASAVMQATGSRVSRLPLGPVCLTPVEGGRS